MTEPPQKDAFLQQLKATSEDWLKNTVCYEIVFSQGIFNEKELKNQVVLTIENAKKKVVGLVNFISDYSTREANFDLMRKTVDALFARMWDHVKKNGFKACNLGMVPMSDIDNPKNLQERVIKLAYEKLKHFGHYKSLREYKEKFNPDWQMIYLVQNDPYNLIYLPSALEQVIEP